MILLDLDSKAITALHGLAVGIVEKSNDEDVKSILIKFIRAAEKFDFELKGFRLKNSSLVIDTIQ